MSLHSSVSPKDLELPLRSKARDTWAGLRPNGSTLAFIWLALLGTAEARGESTQAAAAAEASVSTPPSPVTSAKEVDEASPFLGLGLDVGIPDGVTLAVVSRPLDSLRIAVGLGTNSIGVGLRAGVTWVPFGVGPSLTLEGGHYFDGNANKLVSTFADSSYDGNRMADRIGYDYANIHLGGELGHKCVAFYLHGGMSYLHTTLHNVDDVLGGSSGDGTTTVRITSDPVVTAWIPSVKLGFVLYFI